MNLDIVIIALCLVNMILAVLTKNFTAFLGWLVALIAHIRIVRQD